MYLNYNKPSLNLNYPKNMGLKKKDVIREKNKLGYPKAWNYMKTKTGGHRLKFSKRQFKKFYVKKIKSNSGYGLGDYY